MRVQFDERLIFSVDVERMGGFWNIRKLQKRRNTFFSSGKGIWKLGDIAEEEQPITFDNRRINNYLILFIILHYFIPCCPLNNHPSLSSHIKSAVKLPNILIRLIPPFTKNFPPLKISFMLLFQRYLFMILLIPFVNLCPATKER